MKLIFQPSTQGGKGSSEGKKVQQILTSKYVMGILNWFEIAKNKKIHEAILEIAVNMHSPFCPKLADYSACVPPALQNGFVNSFDFDNFELHKHSYTQFWSQTLLDFFSLWVTLATLGDLLIISKARIPWCFKIFSLLWLYFCEKSYSWFFWGWILASKFSFRAGW